jgi:hypothetical protein
MESVWDSDRQAPRCWLLSLFVDVGAWLLETQLILVLKTNQVLGRLKLLMLGLGKKS